MVIGAVIYLAVLDKGNHSSGYEPVGTFLPAPSSDAMVRYGDVDGTTTYWRQAPDIRRIDEIHTTPEGRFGLFTVQKRFFPGSTYAEVEYTCHWRDRSESTAEVSCSGGVSGVSDVQLIVDLARVKGPYGEQVIAGVPADCFEFVASTLVSNHRGTLCVDRAHGAPLQTLGSAPVEPTFDPASSFDVDPYSRVELTVDVSELMLPAR